MKTTMKRKLRCWIEAMRLRTLPVSVAGVFMAAGCAAAASTLRLLPVALCLLFAVLAQVASNFANEYYDYVGGLDRKGREGPRRGVTEGDITPRAMLVATYLTLGAACCVGLSLLAFGGWWLVVVGVAIALGVLAYSTGPYPLSHHGLGEVAVVAFFGLIPVVCTYVLQGGAFGIDILLAGLSAGLMGANVLIVNNYRDAADDAAVGKHTLAVMMGRRCFVWFYIVDAVAASLLMLPWFAKLGAHAWIGVAIASLYTCASLAVWLRLRRLDGRAINPLLGLTAMLMLATCVAWFVLTVAVGGC